MSAAARQQQPAGQHGARADAVDQEAGRRLQRAEMTL